MIKVLYIVPIVYDVENTTNFQRVKWLSRHCRLHVVSLHPHPIPSALVDARWTFARGRGIIRYICIFRKIMGADVDVVVGTYLPEVIVVCWLAKFLLGKKWIADIYDMPILSCELHRMRKIFRPVLDFMAGFCLRRADHLMITLHEKALAHYKLDNDRVSHFTNGTDISLAERVIKNTNLREKTKDLQTVVYVGHVLRVRGLDLMLEAAQCMQAQGSGAKWVLIGPSRQADEEWLRKEIRHRGLSNIHYLGVLPHKEALQRILSADVCVCPFKKTEGTEYIYPIKVLEYMALGKAIVATDLQGIRRLIQHGESGLLFPDGDARAFYEAVAQLLQNRELRLQMGNKARERARAFDWKSIHDQWIRKLYEVVEGTPHER